MMLKHSKPVVLVSSHCSCVVGCALCNHLVALLYQTAHYSQLSIPAVPLVHSCTDTEQIWHKPRTLVSHVTCELYYYCAYCSYCDAILNVSLMLGC